MAQRAGKEVVTTRRCSASALLRAYMGDLVDTIHGAEIPAITMKLYSRRVISKDTRDRVGLSSLIATEQTSCLLKALESAVTSQPHVLDTFLDILDQYRPAAIIAKKMQDRLRKCVYRLWHSLWSGVFTHTNTYMYMYMYFFHTRSLCSTGDVL